MGHRSSCGIGPTQNTVFVIASALREARPNDQHSGRAGNPCLLLDLTNSGLLLRQPADRNDVVSRMSYGRLTYPISEVV